MFVIYSFWNIGIILYYLSSMMEKGARTNSLDYEIKNTLMKLGKDSIRMKIYANNSQIYKKTGSDEDTGVPMVYILKKVVKGEITTYESVIDGEVYKNIDNFERINDDLIEKLDFYDQ